MSFSYIKLEVDYIIDYKINLKNSCIIESKLSKELIFSSIKERTLDYNLSNIVMPNTFLLKIAGIDEFYLFYTGNKMNARSFYWTHISIKNAKEGSIIYLKQMLRKDIQLIYYVLPMIIWFIAILVMFQNVILMIFMEVVQIIISSIVLGLIKNIGRKKQFYKIKNFIEEL